MNDVYCITCGRSLKSSQKKFCCKECERLHKKGSVIGPYSKDRVLKASKGKTQKYIETHLLPLQEELRKVLELRYVRNVSNLKRIFNVPESYILNYFKYFPEDKALFKEALEYPIFFGKQKPGFIIDLRQKIEKASKKKEITSSNFQSLIEDTGLSIFNLYQFCKIEGYHLPTYEKCKNSERRTSNSEKYEEAKKKMEEDHFEEIYKKVIYVKNVKKLEAFIQDSGRPYDVAYFSVLRYLKEKGVKIRVSYHERRALESFASFLTIPEEEVVDLLEDLKKSSEYYDLKIKYFRILEKRNLLQDRKKNFQKLLKYCEDLEPSLKKIREKNKEIKNNIERRIKAEFGTSSYLELLADLEKLSFENYEEYLQKYQDLYKTSSTKIVRIFENLSEQAKIIRIRKQNKYTTSPEGGSSIEKWVIKYLQEIDCPFETQVSLKSNLGGTYKIDIVIKNKYCLEIQGDYWHSNPLFYKHDFVKINSVFPYFKYSNFKKRPLNKLSEVQKKNLLKEQQKYLKMSEKYGMNNIYYIWEYDINHFPEEVKSLLRRISNE